MQQRILCVCLGNICRSPLAEAILRAQAKDAGMDAVFESAGTTAWHYGSPPDGRAIVAARARGYGIEDLRARKLIARDFPKYGLILAMDRENLAAISQMQPFANHPPAFLLGDFIDGSSGLDIPDPYYSGRFEPVIDMIEAAASGVINYLARATQERRAVSLKDL